MLEFKSYPKIAQLVKARMAITQKLDGTNGQVCIQDGNILVGSRNRWLSAEKDNHEFYAHIMSNKDEYIALLGDGVHHGEWCGPGIQHGEGLTERGFYLFNHWKWFDKELELPKSCHIVPVLYKGMPNTMMIQVCMEVLEHEGSQLVEGYKNVEGIVIEMGNSLFKNTFKREDVSLKGKDRSSKSYSGIDVSDLLQPVRLTKVLGRDSDLMKNFPNSMSDIAKAYIIDLIEEEQIDSKAEDYDDRVKELRRQLFKFIKEVI